MKAAGKRSVGRVDYAATHYPIRGVNRKIMVFEE